MKDLILIALSVFVGELLGSYVYTKFFETKKAKEPTVVGIKTRYTDKAKYTVYHHDMGDMIDIPVQEDVKYKKGDTVFIDFQVAMKLPDGYEAHVFPRSSTFKNYGLILTNGVGVIDNSYCGNNDTWKAMFYATRDGSIEAGSRVVQFRIVKNQPLISIDRVEVLEGEDRGGYGSSGK